MTAILPKHPPRQLALRARRKRPTRAYVLELERLLMIERMETARLRELLRAYRKNP